MKTLRQILDVKSRSLNIHLPEDFNAEKVEVIVISIEEKKDIKKPKPSGYAGCISKETAEAMLK